jgi:hypothetical protein
MKINSSLQHKKGRQVIKSPSQQRPQKLINPRAIEPYLLPILGAGLIFVNDKRIRKNEKKHT